MKTLSAIFLFLFYFPVHKETTSREVLQTMYKRYHGVWHTSLKFNQTTERFRNDSLISSTPWYETIVYPDMLRIDIGRDKSDNGIIFRHDSTYRFRNNKIVAATKGENELIFFLGGMYFMPFDKVLNHFADLHFNLSKFHTDNWKGKPVFVLGADQGGDKVNQLWIDQVSLEPVRYLKYEGNVKSESFFEQHIALGKAWSETKCTFYSNEKLLQVETYHNVTANPPVDKRIFEPAALGQ